MIHARAFHIRVFKGVHSPKRTFVTVQRIDYQWVGFYFSSLCGWLGVSVPVPFLICLATGGGRTGPGTFARYARWPIRGIYPPDKQRNLVNHPTIPPTYPSSVISMYQFLPSSPLPFLLMFRLFRSCVLAYVSVLTNLPSSGSSGSFYVSVLAPPPDKQRNLVNYPTSLPIFRSCVLSMFQFHSILPSSHLPFLLSNLSSHQSILRSFLCLYNT